MNLSLIGLILYILVLLLNVIGLVTDAFLIYYGYWSITAACRDNSTVASMVLSYHFLYLLFITMHLYM